MIPRFCSTTKEKRIQLRLDIFLYNDMFQNEQNKSEKARNAFEFYRYYKLWGTQKKIREYLMIISKIAKLSEKEDISEVGLKRNFNLIGKYVEKILNKFGV